VDEGDECGERDEYVYKR